MAALISVAIAVCLPLFVLVMKETRPTIILRRRAQELNKTRGDLRYVSHGEAEKVRFMAALQVSLTRPLLFLATEPIVIFFSLWVALAVSKSDSALTLVERHVRPSGWHPVHDAQSLRL